MMILPKRCLLVSVNAAANRKNEALRLIPTNRITRLMSKTTRAGRSEPYRRRIRAPPKEQSVFGIEPVDYSVKPPIFPSPPPPPLRGGASRFAIPLSLMVTVGTIVYVYRNNKNDSYEYWKAMETGEAVKIGYGDDDDEDEFDEEEEDE